MEEIKIDKFFIMNVIFLLIFSLIFNFFEHFFISNFLGLICISIYLLYSFFYRINYFLFNILLIIYIFSNVIGVFLIEMFNKKIYLVELALVGEQIGSIPLLVISHILFLEIAYFIFDKYNKKLKFKYVYKKNIIINFLLLFFIMILVYLCFEVFKDGTSLSHHVNKFQYQQKFMSFIELKLSNLLWSFPIILGYLFFQKYKKNSLIIYILVNIYFIFIGQKFSFFIIGFYYFFLNKINTINKTNKKIFFIISFLSLSLIFLVLFQYKNNYLQKSWEEIFIHFFGRIAQQGQLWWATYIKTVNKNILNFNEIIDELKLMICKKEELILKTGIYKIMFLVAPEDIVRGAYNRGVRYAFSTQASFLYYFSWIGLLLMQSIYGFIYGFILKKLKECLEKNKIITLIILSKVYLYANQFYLQSDFYKILSIKMFLVYVVIFLVSKLEEKYCIERI